MNRYKGDLGKYEDDFLNEDDWRDGEKEEDSMGEGEDENRLKSLTLTLLKQFLRNNRKENQVR